MTPISSTKKTIRRALQAAVMTPFPPKQLSASQENQIRPVSVVYCNHGGKVELASCVEHRSSSMIGVTVFGLLFTPGSPLPPPPARVPLCYVYILCTLGAFLCTSVTHPWHLSR